MLIKIIESTSAGKGKTKVTYKVNGQLRTATIKDPKTPKDLKKAVQAIESGTK